MKKIMFIVILFSCALLWAQEEKLPQVVEDNFQKKYPTSKLDEWRYENNMYYIDFNLKSNSYTSVFNKNGVWIETAEIISDFDIPSQLQDYISDNYPDGNISYNELVENADSKKFYRANLYDESTYVVISCKTDGSDIKVISKTNEEEE